MIILMLKKIQMFWATHHYGARKCHLQWVKTDTPHQMLPERSEQAHSLPDFNRGVLRKPSSGIKKGGAPEKWNSSKIGRGERI
jgi:hypothetical protein